MNTSKDSLREKWVSVRGTPTYTLCQGSKKHCNTIIIIIPGLCQLLHSISLITEIWHLCLDDKSKD